jgi:small subunit ribosomal protein S16
MVKIRLQRLGAKGRPFYRVVITKSEAGRSGAYVENIGIYNPIAQPKEIRIDEERALHWLRHGAEPTETTAYLLNKLGILPKYLEERPSQKKKYKFLDKRTAAISKPSAVEAVPAVEAPATETAAAE